MAFSSYIEKFNFTDSLNGLTESSDVVKKFPEIIDLKRLMSGENSEEYFKKILSGFKGYVDDITKKKFKYVNLTETVLNSLDIRTIREIDFEIYLYSNTSLSTYDIDNAVELFADLKSYQKESIMCLEPSDDIKKEIENLIKQNKKGR